MREALRVGATAYVLKEALSIDFVHAVRQAAAGQRYLSPALGNLLIEAYLQQRGETAPDPSEALTPREREVLYLMAQGYSSAEIAKRLVLGVRTIDWHRANVRRKLGLNTSMDLARYAIQHGIVPAPTPPLTETN